MISVFNSYKIKVFIFTGIACIIITSVLLTSCASTETVSNSGLAQSEQILPAESETPTASITPTEQPTITPTATIQPTPTQNPNLLNEYALMYEIETYEEHPEAKNQILEVFSLKHTDTVLVRTAFGLFFFNPKDWNDYLVIDNYLEVVYFDGQEGFLFKPSKVVNVVDGVKELEFMNMIHFTWDGTMLSMDDPVSFNGLNGEEMDIYEYAYSPGQDVFFTESEYQRNETGIRVIPSDKSFFLYKGTITLPYATLSLGDVNKVGKLALSPDGNNFAYKYKSSGRYEIYLGSTDADSSFTPQKIYTHYFDENISDIIFSPDSNMILFYDYGATIGVIDLETSEKYLLNLASDIITDNEFVSRSGIKDAFFFDKNTVVFCTAAGKLIEWNYLTDTMTVHDASDISIFRVAPYDESSVLFAVGNTLSIYNFDTNVINEVASFTENDLP